MLLYIKNYRSCLIFLIYTLFKFRLGELFRFKIFESITPYLASGICIPEVPLSTSQNLMTNDVERLRNNKALL